jgi:hypothetical protein
MPKVLKKKYTHYHKDGSIWAKGFMLGGKMEGAWRGFGKTEVRCARVRLKVASRLGSGRRTIRVEMS